MAQAQTISNRTFVWKGIYFNTMEYCLITVHDIGSTYSGRITGIVNYEPVCIEYEIEADDAYHITSFSIRSVAESVVKIFLQRKNNKWTDGSGHHNSQFDDCIDIDISLTPLTNTFPINNLKLSVGESKSINVIYIDPISQNVKKALQKYTCLGPNKYRYENLASGFTADLHVDAEGMIVNYAGAWSRIYPEQTTAMMLRSVARDERLSEVLIASQGSTALASNADLYAALIGSWEITALDYTDHNKKVASTGEWHFSWVLEGRAIQDVLIAPERTLREPGMSRLHNRYGTTLRIYDYETQQWNVNWFNPVVGSQNSLIARAEGKRIVQEGTGPDGTRLRWIFDDIKPDSFHWYGEVSYNNGDIWQLQTEFWGKRIN